MLPLKEFFIRFIEQSETDPKGRRDFAGHDLLEIKLGVNFFSVDIFLARSGWVKRDKISARFGRGKSGFLFSKLRWRLPSSLTMPVCVPSQ